MKQVSWIIAASGSSIANSAVIPAILATEGSQIIGHCSLSQTHVPLDDSPAIRYPSYEKLIRESGADALYIPLPNNYHLDLIRLAVECGVNVLCEKPLAMNVEEIDEIIKVAEGSSVVVEEAYMTTHSLRDQRLREIARRIGSTEATARFTFENRNFENYRMDRRFGGGALLDVGIYVLDPIIDLFGEPTGIEIVNFKERNDTDMDLEAVLKHPDGKTSRIVTSFVRPEEQFLQFSNGKMKISAARPFTPSIDDVQIVIEDNDGSTSTELAEGNYIYRAMVEDFNRAISTGTRPRRSLEQSRNVQQVIDDIFEAARAIS
ncbi:MAG: Gfo/Idh/MocA family oxidoreductase [Actinomycetota bacterium]|nr:Gfo/Idh/MocA family oxidoreductase [Actinomycetota bacterium]